MHLVTWVLFTIAVLAFFLSPIHIGFREDVVSAKIGNEVRFGGLLQVNSSYLSKRHRGNSADASHYPIAIQALFLLIPLCRHALINYNTNRKGCSIFEGNRYSNNGIVDEFIFMQ